MRGARAKEESGLMAAAAAVGSLPKKWGAPGEAEKAEEGLKAQPWSICPHFWSSLGVKPAHLWLSLSSCIPEPGFLDSACVAWSPYCLLPPPAQ